jgi:hypothetical protein
MELVKAVGFWKGSGSWVCNEGWFWWFWIAFECFSLSKGSDDP